MERPFEGIASHLDLFVGLPSSWSGCLVLLAWAEVVLLLGLGGEVLGEAVPDPLLPAPSILKVLIQLLLEAPLLLLLCCPLQLPSVAVPAAGCLLHLLGHS